MKQATKFLVQPAWRLLMIDMGLHPTDVLTLARLPADLFSREGASLTPAEYFRMWHGIETALGADALPLKLAELMSVETFDPPIFASLCSPNLNVALRRLSHYKRLIGPMILEVDVAADQTNVTATCYGHEEPLPGSLGLVELVFFTQLTRMATRHRVVPLAASLANPPKIDATLREFFGIDIEAGDKTRIVFSAEDAKRPFLTENAAMWNFFEKDLNRRLSEVDAEAGVAERVKSTLLEMLPSGQTSIEDMAKRLAMSKRSLQRHLREESVSYQKLLNDTRKDLALHYLRRSKIPPSEISFLLGFQDGNSFNRAFKSWTGVTPGSFRT